MNEYEHTKKYFEKKNLGFDELFRATLYSIRATLKNNISTREANNNAYGFFLFEGLDLEEEKYKKKILAKCVREVKKAIENDKKFYLQK